MGVVGGVIPPGPGPIGGVIPGMGAAIPGAGPIEPLAPPGESPGIVLGIGGIIAGDGLEATGWVLESEPPPQPTANKTASARPPKWMRVRMRAVAFWGEYPPTLIPALWQCGERLSSNFLQPNTGELKCARMSNFRTLRGKFRNGRFSLATTRKQALFRCGPPTPTMEKPCTFLKNRAPKHALAMHNACTCLHNPW
jgi:hypothetical protein